MVSNSFVTSFSIEVLTLIIVRFDYMYLTSVTKVRAALTGTGHRNPELTNKSVGGWWMGVIYKDLWTKPTRPGQYSTFTGQTLPLNGRPTGRFPHSDWLKPVNGLCLLFTRRMFTMPESDIYYFNVLLRATRSCHSWLFGFVGHENRSCVHWPKFITDSAHSSIRLHLQY